MMRFVRRYLTLLAALVMPLTLGAAATAPTPEGVALAAVSRTGSATTPDGGARYNIRITWHSCQRYSAYITLTDLKADGRYPRGTIVSSYGKQWAHQDWQGSNLLGSGEAVTHFSTYSVPQYSIPNIRVRIENVSGSTAGWVTYMNPLC